MQVVRIIVIYTSQVLITFSIEIILTTLVNIYFFQALTSTWSKIQNSNNPESYFYSLREKNPTKHVL